METTQRTLTLFLAFLVAIMEKLGENAKCFSDIKSSQDQERTMMRSYNYCLGLIPKYCFYCNITKSFLNREIMWIDLVS